MDPQPTTADVAVIGGGAAGLATAIFAARRNPALSIHVLDGAKKLGAKILVSGGGRCNVTNVAVTPDDFRGGSRHVIRRVLDAFTVPQTTVFFHELGVALHEEEHGKLFPDSNRANSVLEALLAEAKRRAVPIFTGHRVEGVERSDRCFVIRTSAGTITARKAVLAAGGMSLPKTGSDGTGYRLALQLGHSLVPTMPSLVPLVLEDDFHAPLSGVSQEVELIIRAQGWKPIRIRGAMLWTHFGVSGPAALDASRFWHQARGEDRSVSLTVNLLPGLDHEEADRTLLVAAESHPRAALHNVLGKWLPARVAAAILGRMGIASDTRMAHFSREHRRSLIQSLLAWPLPVRDSRGYAHAEVTAGGIPLSEIDPATMASRKCPGLFLVGEILDVDGRIGGFNFQWAWSTGWVAGTALADEEPLRTDEQPIRAPTG